MNQTEKRLLKDVPLGSKIRFEYGGKTYEGRSLRDKVDADGNIWVNARGIGGTDKNGDPIDSAYLPPHTEVEVVEFGKTTMEVTEVRGFLH